MPLARYWLNYWLMYISTSVWKLRTPNADGSYAPQTLVEIVSFSIFCAKMLKK